MRTIYLDHASTTYVDPRVLRKMLPYFSRSFGNPSSLHAAGRTARHAVDDARARIAQSIGAAKEEVLFTGSGTESDNLAVIGAAHAGAAFGKHIIVSSVEHKAVLEAARKLEREGFRVTYLPVDATGSVTLAKLRKHLAKDTTLVSIQYANNEIGTIQRIPELSKLIRQFRGERRFPVFHTDACQAAGALPLDVRTLGVDLMTLNGSKIYGPKGVGCLFVKDGVRLEPQVVGGGQEMGLRAGTENVPLIVGLSEALQLADRVKEAERERQTRLRDRFIKAILTSIRGVRLNGHRRRRLPNNVHISVRGVEGESLLLMLDRDGVCCSTGSACSSTDLALSHVLVATGLSPELAQGSIRFTLGRSTTTNDLDRVVRILGKAVERLRQISPTHCL